LTAVTEKRIHAAFEIGVVLKGLNALAECVAGVALHFLDVETIRAFVAMLVHQELIHQSALSFFPIKS